MFVSSETVQVNPGQSLPALSVTTFRDYQVRFIIAYYPSLETVVESF